MKCEIAPDYRPARIDIHNRNLIILTIRSLGNWSDVMRERDMSPGNEGEGDKSSEAFGLEMWRIFELNSIC